MKCAFVAIEVQLLERSVFFAEGSQLSYTHINVANLKRGILEDYTRRRCVFQD